LIENRAEEPSINRVSAYRQTQKKKHLQFPDLGIMTVADDALSDESPET
jgi:hypothetical protein